SKVQVYERFVHRLRVRQAVLHLGGVTEKEIGQPDEVELSVTGKVIARREPSVGGRAAKAELVGTMHPIHVVIQDVVGAAIPGAASVGRRIGIIDPFGEAIDDQELAELSFVFAAPEILDPGGAEIEKIILQTGFIDASEPDAERIDESGAGHPGLTHSEGI